MIIVSKEKPPVFDRLRERFGGKEWEQSDDVIAWDGVIYCKHDISPDVFVHEEKHLDQQREYGPGLEAYLERYLTDREFRGEQEAEAFRIQLVFIYDQVPRRPDAAWCKEKFARDLCGLYDLNITHAQALRLLTL